MLIAHSSLGYCEPFNRVIYPLNPVVVSVNHNHPVAVALCCNWQQVVDCCAVSKAWRIPAQESKDWISLMLLGSSSPSFVLALSCRSVDMMRRTGCSDRFICGGFLLQYWMKKWRGSAFIFGRSRFCGRPNLGLESAAYRRGGSRLSLSCACFILWWRPNPYSFVVGPVIKASGFVTLLQSRTCTEPPFTSYSFIPAVIPWRSEYCYSSRMQCSVQINLHQAILWIYSVGYVDRGVVFLALNLIDGTTLYTMLPYALSSCATSSVGEVARVREHWTEQPVARGEKISESVISTAKHWATVASTPLTCGLGDPIIQSNRRRRSLTPPYSLIELRDR
jgi:hypothetical protein